MGDIHIRKEGRAGRITLTRPKALNALTYEMCLAIDRALIDWQTDDAVALVIIDAEGDKAFCAGGDIAELYRTGKAGDFGYARTFWRDEYRMNARLADYPKPIVALMQGFVMGGGVGLGGHVRHRVVCDSTRIAMPETGIGLIPDVGGSLLLARAPGRLGDYLGLTAARLGPGDAIHAGFADYYIREDRWPELVTGLCQSGRVEALAEARETPPEGELAGQAKQIDAIFGAGSLAEMLAAAEAAEGDLAASAAKAIRRNSPLAMAMTLAALERLRVGAQDIRSALQQEYRATWRTIEQGDFLEGIRAQIIDKDRNPTWKHTLDSVPAETVEAMLATLCADELTFDA